MCDTPAFVLRQDFLRETTGVDGIFSDFRVKYPPVQ